MPYPSLQAYSYCSSLYVIFYICWPISDYYLSLGNRSYSFKSNYFLTPFPLSVLIFSLNLMERILDLVWGILFYLYTLGILLLLISCHFGILETIIAIWLLFVANLIRVLVATSLEIMKVFQPCSRFPRSGKHLLTFGLGWYSTMYHWKHLGRWLLYVLASNLNFVM